MENEKKHRQIAHTVDVERSILINYEIKNDSQTMNSDKRSGE